MSTTRRDQILALMRELAAQNGGIVPSDAAVWRLFRARKQPIAWGIFRRHILLLEKEGRIARSAFGQRLIIKEKPPDA